MAASCAGLTGASLGQIMNRGWLGAARQKYKSCQSQMLLIVVCKPLSDCMKVCTMGDVRKIHLYGKATGSGLDVPGSWVGHGLRESQMVLDRLMETQIWQPPASPTWKVDGSTNNGFCQLLCLRESCPSSPCPVARQLSSSPFVPGNFQASAPLLELRAGFVRE